ncbi:hypothetical protein L6773_17500 [Rhodohalobacter sp. WB101]|uniref:Uncharacterized protein n=1 Tax=Rhodohalobacter sulfatireducens TaxID=2911366 RepID=A0ABS9KHR4_9BACT|nr:hypothetical protein [Rhodohalobacter sulfatireducens]MDR9366416.1 hypothetical protein [Balneolaceae bacterium]MDR9410021.1 hypothetical protein [Balneolaceae bacterium]
MLLSNSEFQTDQNHSIKIRIGFDDQLFEGNPYVRTSIEIRLMARIDCL